MCRHVKIPKGTGEFGYPRRPRCPVLGWGEISTTVALQGVSRSDRAEDPRLDGSSRAEIYPDQVVTGTEHDTDDDVGMDESGEITVPSLSRASPAGPHLHVFQCPLEDKFVLHKMTQFKIHAKIFAGD